MILQDIKLALETNIARRHDSPQRDVDAPRTQHNKYIHCLISLVLPNFYTSEGTYHNS